MILCSRITAGLSNSPRCVNYCAGSFYMWGCTKKIVFWKWRWIMKCGKVGIGEVMGSQRDPWRWVWKSRNSKSKNLTQIRNGYPSVRIQKYSLNHAIMKLKCRMEMRQLYDQPTKIIDLQKVFPRWFVNPQGETKKKHFSKWDSFILSS